MSEYWKSTPKYWCKHCTTYVKDTPFERKQHETTGKHQGNLRRFLRGIQNGHERTEREKQKARDEVERLNRTIGTGSSQTAVESPQGHSSSKKAYSAPSAGDQKRQWAQLAEMGIQVPENFRAEMAMVGEWQSISQEHTGESVVDEQLSIGVRKRKHDGLEDEDEGIFSEPAKNRGWGSTVKRYPGKGSTDLDDLLMAPLVTHDSSDIKPKVKEDETQHLIESSPEFASPGEAEAAVSPPEKSEPSSHKSTDSDGDVAHVKEEALGDAANIPQTSGFLDGVGTPIFKKRKSRVKP